MITQEQINLAEALSRVVMSWLAFLATCLATAAFLGLLFWCIINHQDATAKIVIGFVDVFMLQLLSIIFKHLFYPRSGGAQTATESKAASSPPAS